ncbi:hypothetical protein F2Q69_00034238 [Brassica cretica]|uniref:Uncharacterized protein n=4 Tax=Brassica TaxID=3705 RepID=A0ABQ7BBX9_BRACR|nr:hypothetical protein DY000_02038628 [Brassica cretica]KAF3602982.1 hypothetical protein F2Q69_00034238 [Brassica cretica]
MVIPRGETLAVQLAFYTMLSLVIFAELLCEYTTALTKIAAGIIPRRSNDRRRDIRIGCLSLPRPSSSPVPDFSTHLVDF